MKHDEFRDHEFHCVQKCVRFIRGGSEAHVFRDSEEKKERGDVAVESNAHENPIHATT